VITGVEWLHPNFDDQETDPELVILYKLLTGFGPFPKALVSHVNDEQGGALMEGLWEAIKGEGLYEPFKDWPQNKFPNLDHEAKELISRMTNLDPAQRATISEVMEDPYWDTVKDLRVIGAKGSIKDY
jgi:serine/threonine protein kinase